MASRADGGGSGLTPHFAMVAGEASGDLLGGLLLAGLQRRWPGLHAGGIGGGRMIARGFDAWWPQDRLAVSGFVDALGRYRELATIRRRLGDRLLGAKGSDRVDAFVGIDAPDFNLGLEARLKAGGLRAVHFVSPSIWAWRRGRIETIRRATNLVLCLFPFEPAIYARHDVPATYVGHPLADLIPLEVPRAAAREALGLGPEDEVVALLPGSRRGEVRYIAPRLLAAAALLQRRRPGLRCVLPVAPGLEATMAALAREHAPGVDLRLLDGRSHAALAACDLTLVASGTATLEAALFKRPMVVVYAMHPLNWQIMRRMNYLPWVGLPNILLNDAAVPELLQSEATPERLADAASAWLDDPARGAALAARFLTLHRELRRDTAEAATDAIQKVLAR